MNIPETETRLCLGIEESQDSKSHYSVLDTVSFYVDLTAEINQANNRVWSQTMAFENGHFSGLFIRSLINAARKKIDVRFVRDSYSDYVTNNSFNHLPSLSRTESQFKRFVQLQTGSLIEELEKSDIRTHKTNVPATIYRHTPLPGVIGRDHKKIIVIDDKAYLGGVNFTELDAKRIDFMLKTDNPSIVLALSTLFDESLNDVLQVDRNIPCDQNNILLVDGGEPGESIIIQNAYDIMNNEADSIVLISPYPPAGKLLSQLNNAVKRGVKVKFITSSKGSLVSFAPKVSQLVHQIGTRKPLFSILHVDGIVHAKALLACGNREAMIGSHNFDEIFVKLGTEEVSLRTCEPAIISELDGYISSLKILE